MSDGFWRELLKNEIDLGESNKTCGKNPVQGAAKIEMDKNDQPRFCGKQNHRRVVTEPIGCLWYAGNSDTQFMLINAISLKT
jgi:hypothetical protein